jgi:hypothetical protein
MSSIPRRTARFAALANASLMPLICSRVSAAGAAWPGANGIALGATVVQPFSASGAICAPPRVAAGVFAGAAIGQR